jgi:hypothetical protein
MLTEVEEDESTWASSTEEKEASAVDPFNTAINALNRLSIDIGEKTILSACTPLI